MRETSSKGEGGFTGKRRVIFLQKRIDMCITRIRQRCLGSWEQEKERGGVSRGAQIEPAWTVLNRTGKKKKKVLVWEKKEI